MMVIKGMCVWTETTMFYVKLLSEHWNGKIEESLKHSYMRSRDSSVVIAAAGWSGVQFPAEARYFALLHSVQTDFGTRPVSCTMGTSVRLHGIVLNQLSTTKTSPFCRLKRSSFEIRAVYYITNTNPIPYQYNMLPSMLLWNTKVHHSVNKIYNWSCVTSAHLNLQSILAHFPKIDLCDSMLSVCLRIPSY